MEDPNAFPMVAIRSSGLAFESLVGFIPNPTADGDEVEEHITLTASETYLELLLGIANDRFRVNTERTQRFEQALFKKMEGLGPGWEDEKSRQDRKRAEGLELQRMRQKAKKNRVQSDLSPMADIDEDVGTGLFGSSLLP